MSGQASQVPVSQDVSGYLLPRTPGVHWAGELITWGSSGCWLGLPFYLDPGPECTLASPSNPPGLAWPTLYCDPSWSPRRAPPQSLTTEAAHQQCHARLLSQCHPLKLAWWEGAGGCRTLLLHPAQGLHDSVLAHSLETSWPIVRHKPSGGVGQGGGGTPDSGGWRVEDSEA